MNLKYADTKGKHACVHPHFRTGIRVVETLLKRCLYPFLKFETLANENSRTSVLNDDLDV